jgi:hypothetical protein
LNERLYVAIQEVLEQFEDVPCDYKDCNEKGTYITWGKKSELGIYCYKHSDKVEDEGFPEYVSTCNLCGCNNPVN